MSKPRTLLQTVQKLNKEELVRYASNMGMEVDEKLTAKERYNFGLTKVNKEKDPDYKDGRNLTFAFTIGYKFGL